MEPCYSHATFLIMMYMYVYVCTVLYTLSTMYTEKMTKVWIFWTKWASTYK